MKEKERILDSFYAAPPKEESQKPKIKPIQTENGAKAKITTYSIKSDNLDYIELRATYFSSKSAYINWLVEKDAESNEEIATLAKSLAQMKHTTNAKRGTNV